MPLERIKAKQFCTSCGKILTVQLVYTFEIRYNRKSALVEEPVVIVLRLCADCHAQLTDRMFSSMMLVDQIDIGQHYGSSY